MRNFDQFFLGYEMEAYRYFGCHPRGNGVEFVLYAPHASRVDVFSSREDFKVFYPMHKIDERGVWYLFIDDMEFKYM